MALLDFVITCMGRLSFLQQTLGRVAAQPNCNPIVVDYSCPDRSGDWVEANFPTVRVVRMPGNEYYSHSRARNGGARAGNSPWICFTDSDILTSPLLAESVTPLLQPRCYYRFAPLTDGGLWGTFICSREAYERVGGFDEILDNWGNDDLDMFELLKMSGLTEQYFSSSLLQHIPHDNDLRTKHHKVKDKLVALLINRFYCQLKYDLVRLSGKPLDASIKKHLYSKATDLLGAALPSERPATMQCQFARDALLPGWRLERTIQFHLLKE
jgi:hypothetical protein